MKELALMVVGLMALTGCKVDLSSMNDELVEASDNIVTKEYKLDKFEEVKMSGVGDVQIFQDEKKNGIVELTAPDNYIDLFKIESEGGKLTIGLKKGHINIHVKDLKIKVYTSDLVKLTNSGASKIAMDSLDTDKLEIINSGVGGLFIHKLIADEVTAKCSGVGSIDLEGQTVDADLTCSGVGSINAENLKAQNVNGIVSGVGGITCYAKERIDGKVSGVGSLRYGGNPKTKNTKRTGVGSINEM